MESIHRLKQRVIADVDSRREQLIRIADTIHNNPELAFQEFESSALLSGILEENGFTVKRGVAEMETAFVAALDGREGGPTVAFLAEYDALPGLGHACGHNLIGTAATGAGLAMKNVLPALRGSIQVVGTPAEEMGGGKAVMVDAGVFDDIDAAMLVHPSTRTSIGNKTLALYRVKIEFFGKAAHATVQPEAGINALEALMLTFSGANAMRQHLRADARVYGIITAGGEAPNIVPDYAAGEFGIRALDAPYAAEVVEKLRACANGAAQATGARLEFKLHGPHYDPMNRNPKLIALVNDNMTALGLKVILTFAPNIGAGSSDMGNVSQVVPALHPSIAIGPHEKGAQHTAGFREAAGSDAGHEGLVNAAKVMAMTAVDLLTEPANMLEVKRGFEEQVSYP
jgi:amidohydrolase